MFLIIYWEGDQSLETMTTIRVGVWVMWMPRDQGMDINMQPVWNFLTHYDTKYGPNKIFYALINSSLFFTLRFNDYHKFSRIVEMFVVL